MGNGLATQVWHLLSEAGRLTVWLALLMAVFVPLEWLGGLHGTKLWRKQVGVDLCWYFINSLLPALALGFPLALLADVVQRLNLFGLYSTVGHWPLWLRVFLSLFASDVGAYWGHRAMHSHRFLWRFHALHHSAEEMDWLVNTRAHPFDTVFVRLAALTPVYLLGLAQTGGAKIDPAVAILTVFGTLWTFFIHADFRVRLGFLEKVVSTPAFHHWHHTKNEFRDRNFSFVFPFIDRVFGTSWLPQHWPSAYGINTPMPTTLAGQFFEPLEPARRPATKRSPDASPAFPTKEAHG